jgi:hypothetical protein
MGACDVLIIGTDVGGGTLARYLAPLGQRLLVNGDCLPREPPPAPAHPHKERDPCGRLCVSSRSAGLQWGQQ